jgi:DNA polymerase
VVFVGEGPGQTEDQQGRPFVGRAGELLVKLLSTLGWRRNEVFITNIVKCRPPGNRDPEPDEIAACAPYLQRQLAVLDPAVVVTLGRFSMAHFRPGERITQIHGTAVVAPTATGARDALALALYHPAAALRSTDVERQSYDDIARLPRVLTEARARRAGGDEPAVAGGSSTPMAAEARDAQDAPTMTLADPGDDAPTLFQAEA